MVAPDEERKGFGRDILTDVRNRLPWYADDWATGFKYGWRIFAPATYIFFTSLLPAISFGEQLAKDTEGVFTVVHVLVACAYSGVGQALFGGQPLVINGVAQPIVTILSFMYQFIKDRDDLDVSMYLPWCAWTGIFAAIFLILMALFGACRLVHRFTRLAGETFGMLIAVLFLQQAIRGLIAEFQPLPDYKKGGGLRNRGDFDLEAPLEVDEPHWILVNGLWGLLLAAGMLYTSLLVVKARSWQFGNGLMRGLLADYGVPLMVVVWSALSYALQSGGNPRGVPSSLPRRVTTPLTWQVTETWDVAARMTQIPGPLIAAALIPGAIIAILFWFDHGVSSKLGQQKEFNLQKPPAYAYDQCLLALFMVIAGLLGLPPPNGVLPQTPMHTRSLATLRMQTEADKEAKRRSRKRKEARAKAKYAQAAAMQVQLAVGPSITRAASPEPQARRSTGAEEPTSAHGDGEAQKSPFSSASQQQQQQQQQQPGGRGGNSAHAGGEGEESMRRGSVGGGTDAGESDVALPMELSVAEQRLTNLIQSILIAICLGIVHLLQFIPTAVVWAYFAYMAVESMPGSQFYDRMLLMFTDKRRYKMVLAKAHAPYIQTVPFRIVAAFTAFQFSWLAGLWALVTWAGIGGVAFPAPVVLLVPVRSYILPRVFKPEHLAELDQDEFDMVEPQTAEEAEEEIERGVGEYDETEAYQPERLFLGTQALHRVSLQDVRRRSVIQGGAAHHQDGQV